MNKKSIFLLLSIIMFINSAFAWDKDNATKMIKAAEEKLDSIDNLTELKSFIPYDKYYEGLINIMIARSQLDKEDYDDSYFYASLSIIKIETAITIAQTRELKYKKILTERNYYINSKKAAGNEDSSLKHIINANLHKKGKVYRIELLDKKIFKKDRFRLTSNGKAYIKKIVQVLKAYPDCRIKIVGHTAYYDARKYSKHKAEVVASYIIKQGIKTDRTKFIGIGNKEVMDTPVGYRRINRVEVILSGIDWER